jgi:hypothetical protein
MVGRRSFEWWFLGFKWCSLDRFRVGFGLRAGGVEVDFQGLAGLGQGLEGVGQEAVLEIPLG